MLLIHGRLRLPCTINSDRETCTHTIATYSIICNTMCGLSCVQYELMLRYLQNVSIPWFIATV